MNFFLSTSATSAVFPFFGTLSLLFKTSLSLFNRDTGSKFQFKAGCCIYVGNDITCYRAHDSVSWEFFNICLINCQYISNNFTSSSFPSLLSPAFTTSVASSLKAELFARIISENSTPDDSGHIHPIHPFSDFATPDIYFKNCISYAYSGMNVQKAYGSSGILYVVPKNHVSVLTLCLVQLFRLCLSISISLLVGTTVSLHTVCAWEGWPL